MASTSNKALILFLIVVCYETVAISLRSNPNFQMQRKETIITTAKVNEMVDNLEADKLAVGGLAATYEGSVATSDSASSNLAVQKDPAVSAIMKLMTNVVPVLQVFKSPGDKCAVTCAQGLESGYGSIKSALKLDQIFKAYGDENAKISTAGKKVKTLTASHVSLVNQIMTVKSTYLTAKQALLDTNGGDVSPDIKNNLGKIVGSMDTLATDSQRLIEAATAAKTALVAGQAGLATASTTAKGDLASLKSALNAFIATIQSAKSEAKAVKDTPSCENFKKAYEDTIAVESDVTAALAKLGLFENALTEAAAQANAVSNDASAAVSGVSGKVAGTKTEIQDAKAQLQGLVATIG